MCKTGCDEEFGIVWEQLLCPRLFSLIYYRNCNAVKLVEAYRGFRTVFWPIVT